MGYEGRCGSPGMVGGIPAAHARIEGCERTARSSLAPVLLCARWRSQWRCWSAPWPALPSRCGRISGSPPNGMQPLSLRSTRCAACSAPATVSTISRLPLVARLAGLKDLRFDTDEDSAAGREAQSLHDEHGRIVGWFSWAADRTLIRAEIWLWGLIGAVGAALGVCAFLAARPDPAAGALARVEPQNHPQADPRGRADRPAQSPGDAGTPRPGAGRRHSGVVVLALIDLDGFREVNDTLGRSGGDARA